QKSDSQYFGIVQYGHLFSVENFVGDTLGILILRTEITHTKKGVISHLVQDIAVVLSHGWRKYAQYRYRI
ncbi:hypothetical protein, partial [Serratia nevei]|uniref:hypothetical protein n=1 Tax=Serratia nevei TaxID=2703794 RepID=UPI002AA0C333